MTEPKTVKLTPEQAEAMLEKLRTRGPQYSISPERTVFISIDGTVLDDGGKAVVTRLYEDDPEDAA